MFGAALLIELTNVEKRFGELRALRGITLSLEGGSIGLLGPNGAGKSTFMKVLLGLLPSDAGSVVVLGRDVAHDPHGVRARIGYMPEGDAVIPELTALDFVGYAGELCGLPTSEARGRAHQVLHYVGLGEARYRKLGQYSTGMRQRAKLAQALVGDPKLLLLDEPTSGLDPSGREEMLSLVRDIPQRTGAHVILSTHILSDVERVCDQLIVMREGQVLYSGEIAPLVSTSAGVYELRVKGSSTEVRKNLELERCVVTEDGPSLHVRLPDGAGTELILKVAVASKAQIRHLAPLKKTLEEAFLEQMEAAGERVRASAESSPPPA